VHERILSVRVSHQALNMVAHVRQSFSEILQELTWLEDGTKKVAQEKVCGLHLLQGNNCTASYTSSSRLLIFHMHYLVKSNLLLSAPPVTKAGWHCF